MSASSNISLQETAALENGGSIHYRLSQTLLGDLYTFAGPTQKYTGTTDGELRLHKLRRRIPALRLQVYIQQGIVNARRKTQFEADEQYIKKIRINHVTREQPGQKSSLEINELNKLWRSCQAARNEYGPAVDSLVAMKNRLEVEENKLTRIEERVYKQFNTFQPTSSSLLIGPRQTCGIIDAGLRRARKPFSKISGLRLQIHEQREIFKAKQDTQFELDERFMKMVRTNHVIKEQPVQMSFLEIDELESIWRLYQTAQNEHDAVKDSLVAMEYRLETKENKLVRIMEHKQIDSDDSEEDSDGTSSNSFEEDEQTGEVNYEGYLRRLGNLDLLEEEFQSLITEKAMIEDKQELRWRVGKELDSEDRDFLAHFEGTVKSLAEKIEEVSSDVNRLKQICIENGLMDAEGNHIRPSTTDDMPHSELGDQMEIVPAEKQSKPSQLQRPSDDDKMELGDSDSHGGFGPFVNLWLLHTLRLSRWQMFLLARWIAASVQNMNGLKWQAEAVMLWEKDGAGRDPPEDGDRIESYSASSEH